MKLIKFAIIAGLILAITASAVPAKTWQEKVVLRGAISGYIPASSNLGQIDGGGIFKITAAYELSPKFLIEGSIGLGALTWMRQDSLGSDSDRNNPSFFPFNLNASYLVYQKNYWNIRLLGGFGYYPLPGLEVYLSPGKKVEEVMSSNGVDFGLRYSRVSNIFGFGNDYFIEFIGHYWADEDAFTKNFYEGTASMVEISFGVSYWLGGKPYPPPPSKRPLGAVGTPEEKPAKVIEDEMARKDSDKDGVPDIKDKSPNTPEGVTVDEYGRPLDHDMDGVPDYIDLSPNTPLGVKVDSHGRPLDTDGDGVPDFRDREPDTPSGVLVDEFGRGEVLDADGDGVPDHIDRDNQTPKGVAVDEYGVTLPKIEESVTPVIISAAPVKINEGVLKSVKFASGKTNMLPGVESELNNLVKALQTNPGVKIELRGYTDISGSKEGNIKFSQLRAEVVRKFLVDKGIASDRIIARGYGATNFINTENTRAAENRRIEVVVIKKLLNSPK